MSLPAKNYLCRDYKNKPNHGGPKREKSAIKNIRKGPSLKIWVGISREKKPNDKDTKKIIYSSEKVCI